MNVIFMFLREHILTHAHRARCFVGSFSPVGLVRRGCYNPAKRMADWKQITARIRRARTGKDPAGQLTNLFSKTRDAMVAFELARYFEANGNNADAGRWYLTAAERFRRADWKTKAQESATRLGATEPAEIPAPPPPAEKQPEAAPVSELEAEAAAQPAVELEEVRETVEAPAE